MTQTYGLIHDGDGPALTLDQFGERLLHAAVTPARVADIVRRVLGEEIRFGPVDVGPAGLVSATALGRLTSVRARPEPDDRTRLRVRVSVVLEIVGTLGVEVTRFLAHAAVELDLRVVPRNPLWVTVAIAEPSAGDVSVRLVLPGGARRLLVLLTDVEATLRRYICEFVRDLVASPAARRYTRINLEELIEQVWEADLIGGRDAAEHDASPPRG